MSVSFTGHKFGNWIVGHKDETRPGYWHCICNCGTLASIWLGNLKNGSSTGCIHCRGLKNKKHGKASAKIYDIWYSIKDRCENKNNASYANYGGRGIKLCHHWQSFENFYADMGDKPKNMSIDRVDNSKDYSPENCRWVTVTTQNRNKRNNRLKFAEAMEIRYSTLTPVELATKFNIATPNVYAIRSGATWKASTLPQMVAECYTKFNMPKNEKPGPLDKATWELREKLILEELGELRQAISTNNIVDMADACIDLLYVTVGTLLTMGLSVEHIDACTEAIQASNMAKVRCTSSEESKRGTTIDLRKPADWVGPEAKIKSILFDGQ